jgi:hypothetical protein
MVTVSAATGGLLLGVDEAAVFVVAAVDVDATTTGG